MSAFFVTATGTDIGKTFVTAGLIRHLRGQNCSVSALKPVVSGFEDRSSVESDPGVLLTALGRPINNEEIERIAPWRFAAPLSPDMAAGRDGKAIDFHALVKFCQEAVSASKGILFIEGVGGIMVPLNHKHTTLDWMVAVRLPIILVTGTYLGTLSHTLTALEVLRAHNLQLAALVMNESAASTVSPAETAASIKRFAPGIRTILLPRHADAAAFARAMAALGPALTARRRRL
jgi:dethiobiotin synthetase